MACPEPLPYSVRQVVSGIACLMRGDAELLCGPRQELELMASQLNALPPPGPEVALRLRNLITQTRGCSFAPGPQLLRAMSRGGRQ